jgi:hypothetical protein
MSKFLLIGLFLVQTQAIAGVVYEYPVYTNPKTISGDAKNIRLVNAEVKKVPATYTMEIPWNCNNSENDCREQEVVVSKVKVVQATVAFQDGRTDDYGHAEDSYTEINLPLNQFSEAQVKAFSSKKRKTRQATRNETLKLVVAQESVPVEREKCHLVNENWVCDGTYTDEVTVTNVGVEVK